ncbi:cytochrome P450 302a1, mitochondrial isoform X2 [Hyposmocoma kahamanoa]|uniref:cytochrome P450 302a1, mitochondrial isoform X2 n=1 Tax=Hyposmocoma kahamanoa TaxID=1477025 RepID=UPI000E6DA3EB|nr:cytochrome P450 302a1, mitochondrial isoform X2 [Hyposmocoma kahamanoa]
MSSDNLKSFNEIPGPKSYPIIGTIYKYLPLVGDYKPESLDEIAWLNYKRYGPFVREEPGIRVLHIYEPEVIEAMFRQDDRNGSEWWRLRSAFQKNFTAPQSVKEHVTDTDAVVQELVRYVKDYNISCKEDFLESLNRLNLEIIGQVAFNERFNSFSHTELDSKSRSSSIIAAAFGSNIGINRLDRGFLWKLFQTPLYKKLAESQNYLEKVSNEILLKKIDFYEKQDSCTDKSLIASFLQSPNVDLKDIKGMMVDILMASIDTTAYSTSFALYHLGRNPAVQEKLCKEILTLLPTKDYIITADILSKATYVRSCVKESLRLNPVSVGIGRILQKDIILKGFLIPNGTVIVTQNMLACRLPQYVKEPLKFKPERWLRGSPEYEKFHPFLSLPFGFGPRSCIARRLAEQNICITLMRLFREFEIKWMGGEELGIRAYLINKPDQPITLNFCARVS